MGLGLNLAWQHPEERLSEGNNEPVVPHRCGPKREPEVGLGLGSAGTQIAACTAPQPGRSYILVHDETGRSIAHPSHEKAQVMHLLNIALPGISRHPNE